MGPTPSLRLLFKSTQQLAWRGLHGPAQSLCSAAPISSQPYLWRLPVLQGLAPSMLSCRLQVQLLQVPLSWSSAVGSV